MCFSKLLVHIFRLINLQAQIYSLFIPGEHAFVASPHSHHSTYRYVRSGLLLCTCVVCIVDYSSGFGGKYGVQKDRQDSSAVGFDHTEKLSQHSSQKDYSTGFGGKYGVQTDRKDEVTTVIKSKLCEAGVCLFSEKFWFSDRSVMLKTDNHATHVAFALQKGIYSLTIH